MSIEYTIFCDVCGEILDASTISAAIARKVVKEELDGAQRGRRDYCHKCKGPVFETDRGKLA